MSSVRRHPAPVPGRGLPAAAACRGIGMTIARSLSKTVAFAHPFALKGIDRERCAEPIARLGCDDRRQLIHNCGL